MMIKLISTTAAVMFAAVALADAAPRQGTANKAGKTAQVKAVKTTAKPANRRVARAKYRRPAAAQKAAVKVQRPVVKPETTVAPAAVKTTFAPVAVKSTVAPVAIRSVRHDLNAEEVELKRLKSDVKASQKAGDWRRVARDR